MKTTLDISILVVNVGMMVAVGTGLETRHFVELTRQRRVVPAALIGQMVLLPAIGWCVARVMALPAHLCAGILLMAACPVGDIASFYSILARANTALCVAVNTLSCLLAVPTMAAGWVVSSLMGLRTAERTTFAVVYFLAEVPLLLGIRRPAKDHTK